MAGYLRVAEFWMNFSSFLNVFCKVAFQTANIKSKLEKNRTVRLEFKSRQAGPRVHALTSPKTLLKLSSVQFSRLVMSNSLRPYRLQQVRPPCPSSITKLMSIELVMPSNHLILCSSLLLAPSIFPSIRVFSNESVLRIRWPKYWSFSFNISPSNEHPGLISFRTDWLDLLAVQGTLKSLLQHHFKSINSSALSFLYSTTFTSIHDYWKNHSLD